MKYLLKWAFIGYSLNLGMPNLVRLVLCVGASAAFTFALFGQGETTSAILGQVNDPTNSPVGARP